MPIKSTFLIHTLLICLLLVSCKKTIEEPSIYTGEFSALKQGTTWEALPYAFFPSSNDTALTIVAEILNEEGFLRQSLSFTKVPPKEGDYPLYKSSSAVNDGLVSTHYFTFLTDGDVIEADWEILDTADNFLRITNLDLATGEVSGQFDMVMVLDSLTRSFYLDELEVDLPYEDTIRFTNGEFATKISE